MMDSLDEGRVARACRDVEDAVPHDLIIFDVAQREVGVARAFVRRVVTHTGCHSSFRARELLKRAVAGKLAAERPESSDACGELSVVLYYAKFKDSDKGEVPDPSKAPP